MTGINTTEFLASFMYFLFVVAVIFFMLYGAFDWAKELLLERRRALRVKKKKPQRRFMLDEKLQFTDPGSPNSLLDGEVLNISETGMFVNTYVKTLPKPGDVIEFKIKDVVTKDKVVTIKGKGVVRWVREEDNFGIDKDLSLKSKETKDFPLPTRFWPAGFGVEFSTFEADSTAPLTHLMNELKNQSFG